MECDNCGVKETVSEVKTEIRGLREAFHAFELTASTKIAKLEVKASLFGALGGALVASLPHLLKLLQ